VSADVAIVIVTYNSVHVVGDLLDSIPDALGGLTAEVVVVDNGSSDATVGLLEQRADCRVVRSTNVGYAGGVNRGAAATGCDTILILNPDTRLADGCILALTKALRVPGTGIAVPQVHGADGSLEMSLRREPSLLRALGLTATKLAALSEYVTGPAEYHEPRAVDWALGAVLLMSRECYDAVGGWDESYFLYSEETDFCLRARDLGFATRYEPGAVAIHIGAQSGQSKQTHAMQVVNRVRLYRRRHNIIAAWAYFALTILSESTWILRGQPQSRYAIAALLRPKLRPAVLGCSDQLMPR
jgi:N-acetylglucosaminyl-diphospho-decaprenol L-rhamnosyltransferase